MFELYGPEIRIRNWGQNRDHLNFRYRINHEPLEFKVKNNELLEFINQNLKKESRYKIIFVGI